MRDFYLLLNTSVAVALLALGVVALINNRKSFLNQLFFSFAVCVAIWLVAACVSNDTRNSVEVSVYGNYAVFFFSYFASMFMLWFAAFLAAIEQVRRHLKFTNIPLILIGLVSGTPLVVAGAESQGDVYAVTFGPLIGVYALALVGMLIGAVWVLRAGLKRAHGKRRSQILMMLRTLAVALPILIVTQFVAPALTGSFEITDAGILVMALPVAGLYMSVVRHGLFDIRLAAVRTVAYVLALLTLAAGYYAVAYVISVSFFRGEVTNSFSVSPLNIVLALLLAFVFQPIKSFFDRATNSIFYRDQYDSDEFYGRLSATLTSTTDLRTLLERASTEIGTTLKAEQTFFYAYYDDHDHHASAGTTNHQHLTHEDVQLFDQYIRTNNADIVVTQLVEDHDMAKVLARRKIGLLLPLLRDSDIVGYLVLGQRLSGDYNKRDVHVLLTVADELLIAIQNTLSVQQVKEANALLEERVRQATTELRASNSQLRRIDATKDEFISMASHQLRTPLTSVKGYISMVLDGDVGPISEQQQKVLQQAFESSQRMVFLIGDFLNVSRIQTGKFMLEPTEFDIAALVREEVDQLVDTAKGRGLEIIYNPPDNIPPIVADKMKLRQVMMNFLDNAIFYSPDGGTITVQLYKDASSVVYKVIDSGIGVPKAEQAKLFSKFFRAGNARKQRPDGTGVGIYMAKKVVVSHGGTILFESKEGKGSTFGFTLPLKNNLDQLGK